MIKFALFAKTAKAMAFIFVNVSLMFSHCVKVPVQTAVAEPTVQAVAEPTVSAVAEPTVQGVASPVIFDENGNMIEDGEEDLCSSEGINYPENDKQETAIPDGMDDPTEDTESDEDIEEVKLVDGKLVPVSEIKDNELVAEPDTDDEEDLCSSEGINYPENDKQETAIPDGMEDPTEDTESEEDTQEVKIVDGKIIPVSDASDNELIAVPDTEEGVRVHAIGTALSFDRDGNVYEDGEVKVGAVASPVIFDENGNVIKDNEEDLCSSEGINYPENDKQETAIPDGMDDPTEDTESETDIELVKVEDTDDAE